MGFSHLFTKLTKIRNKPLTEKADTMPPLNEKQSGKTRRHFMTSAATLAGASLVTGCQIHLNPKANGMAAAGLIKPEVWYPLISNLTLKQFYYNDSSGRATQTTLYPVPCDEHGTWIEHLSSADKAEQYQALVDAGLDPTNADVQDAMKVINAIGPLYFKKAYNQMKSLMDYGSDCPPAVGGY